MEVKTVGSVVASDYRAASVFHKHGIDFCCQGGQTLDEACRKKGLDREGLLAEIEAAVRSEDHQQTDYDALPLDVLSNHIEKKHHAYVAMQLPVLLGFLEKLCRVHGGRHPELHEISTEFSHMAEELSAHMKKEEMVLFPHIRKMVASQKDKDKFMPTAFGTVRNPISMMMHEHSVEGERLARIAGLSNDYTVPPDGCTTYRVAYGMLRDFESDLHLHIHLENNILFPKSVALEESLS